MKDHAMTEDAATDPHSSHQHEGWRKQEDSNGHAAHVDHSGHEQMFRRRFWVCLVLTIPVLLYSPMLQHWFGFSMPAFPGSDWIGPLFAIVVFAYGGIPFLQMAVPETAQPRAGHDDAHLAGHLRGVGLQPGRARHRPRRRLLLGAGDCSST